MDCIYCHSISDIDFGLEYKLSFEEKSNQAIALYALSGKFQIYYVLDSFEVERINEKEIAIYPTQIKAYIDDSFDFRDQPMQFVGAWNYEKMEFIAFNSVRKMIREVTGSTKVISIGNVKEVNENIMFNQDYQNTQTHFNLGLDFRILTSTFKDIQVYPLSMPISIKVD